MTRVVRRIKEGRGRPRACSCGECERCRHTDYQRAWYERQTPERRVELAQIAGKRKAVRAARWRVALAVCKSFEGCLYCGEDDPCALDWHHRNPEEKHNDLAVLVGMVASSARIVAEIEKCDVVCANCHRKLAAGRELTPRGRVLRAVG